MSERRNVGMGDLVTAALRDGSLFQASVVACAVSRPVRHDAQWAGKWLGRPCKR